ncbi:Chemotaxis protein methyltransferase CheR [Chondromyces apiculatus DSM 436]|uniref:Chemotaxis protein methyltransferase CheR n=1 Tax=Chondromyces apiculatus DSM 436 TaxID=1192034 RepID=A0A017SW85_9BACT|nr:Chemotaxis protein methyltransferase CheR [Chondromyces apiculatus DSM 436]
MDLALAAAERDLGVGRAMAAPGWVRDRVLTILEAQAARLGITAMRAAERLQRDRSAVEEIVAALRVGETRFYRDPVMWEAIASAVIPTLPQRPVAGLSAGCSTGEEAYTLAMMLAIAGKRFSVLGVDRSSEAVQAAREATYSAEAARHLPPAYVRRFCEVDGSVMRVRKELRSLVSFEVCDLVSAVPRGGFQIILFKNVLLYLATPAGEAVARRLLGELDARGVLITAASEVPRLCSVGIATARISSGVTAFRLGPRTGSEPPPPPPAAPAASGSGFPGGMEGGR